MNAISRIGDIASRVHTGDPWYGPSVEHVLDGVSAARAADHPVPGSHSIWETVLHMTSWTREVIRRLDGGSAGLPVEGDWPATGDVTEERWREARLGLQRAHVQFIERVRTLAESDLDRMTGKERNPAEGSGVSVYALVHGLLQHHAYHAGQIALLRKIT